ncbi:hypothetical protein RFI_31272, partial [Reticulomyxa filosa]
LRYFQFVKEINCKGDRLHMVQFSPDGQKFVTASRSKIIRIWDVNSGKMVKQLKGHSSHTNQVLFSPDGTMILSCLFDNTICLWNVESGIEIKKLEGHADNIDSAHFSPDGTIIAFFSSGTTNIWDLQSGQVRLLSDVMSTFGAFSPNGQQIVLFTWDNSVLIFDVRSGEETNLNCHYFPVLSPSYGKNQIWDVASKTKIKEFGGCGLKFFPDKQTIIGLANDMVTLWDAKLGIEMQLLNIPKHLTHADISPDGNTIISCSDDGAVQFWVPL